MTVANRPTRTGRPPAPKINKAALVRLAIEVRAELGLDEFVPLDPYALAKFYGVPVYTLDDLRAAGCPEAPARYFAEQRPEAWSAALVPDGTGMFIVENTAHQLQRHRSNIAHEIAHVLREHLFSAPLIGGNVGSSCVNAGDRHQEQEAAELGAELLLPKAAAMRAALMGHSDAQVATRFDVSVELAGWRLKVTGARTVAERAAAKRAGGRRLGGDQGAAEKHSLTWPRHAAIRQHQHYGSTPERAARLQGCRYFYVLAVRREAELEPVQVNASGILTVTRSQTFQHHTYRLP